MVRNKKRNAGIAFYGSGVVFFTTMLFFVLFNFMSYVIGFVVGGFMILIALLVFALTYCFRGLYRFMYNMPTINERLEILEKTIYGDDTENRT